MAVHTQECEKVIEWIKDKGHFDQLRDKVVEELRNSDKLREKAEELMKNSKVLEKHANTPLDTKANKDKVFRELRAEIEKDLQSHAATIAWSIISNSKGDMFKEIHNTVHHALCTLYEEQQLQAEQPQHPPTTTTTRPSLSQAAGSSQPSIPTMYDAGHTAHRTPVPTYHTQPPYPSDPYRQPHPPAYPPAQHHQGPQYGPSTAQYGHGQYGDPHAPHGYGSGYR